MVIIVPSYLAFYLPVSVQKRKKVATTSLDSRGWEALSVAKLQ